MVVGVNVRVSEGVALGVGGMVRVGVVVAVLVGDGVLVEVVVRVGARDGVVVTVDSGANWLQPVRVTTINVNKIEETTRSCL